jgi:hypothetical protein
MKGFNYPFFLYGNQSGTTACHPSTPDYIKFTGGERVNPTLSDATTVPYLEDNKPRNLHLVPNAQRNAWHAMQPRFEGQISMINALFELKDFRDIMGTFARLAPWNIPNLISKGMRKRRRHSDPTKPLAAAHLTNELALKPLLRDISAVMLQINQIVEYAQSEFFTAGLDSQKSHYTAILDEVDETSHLTYGGWYDTYGGKFDTTKFTATLEYQYQYKCRDLISAFIKYWGLGITYEALWNAAPWTFVADYFLGISSSIHNMEKDGNVDLRYSQYCESLLRTKTQGAYIGRGWYSYIPSNVYLNGLSTQGHLLSTWNERIAVDGYQSEHYSRRVCSPNKGAALPIIKMPKSKQWLTMGALLRTFL